MGLVLENLVNDRYCSGSQASKHMRNGRTASTILWATRAPFFCSLVLPRNRLARNKRKWAELADGQLLCLVILSSAIAISGFR